MGNKQKVEHIKIPPEHVEEFLHCAGDQALQQVSQTGCGVFLHWEYSKYLCTNQSYVTSSR